MERQNLIFFSGMDPKVSTKPTWSAYHFALVAQRAGLQAEVRLAGDAVEILKPGGIPEGEDGERLRKYMTQALETDLFVSG